MTITVNDLPLRERVQAFYKGTDGLFQFSRDTVFPLLESIQKLGSISAKEAAILIIYYRMHNWIDSMVYLNRDTYYQAAVTAARALFELVVDLKLLSGDKGGKDAEKFFAFEEVDKFNSAEGLTEFINAHPDCEEEDDYMRRDHLNMPGLRDRVDKIALELWGVKKEKKRKQLSHWSGLSLRQRVKKLDKNLQAMYWRYYKHLSWYVHPGSQGHANMPPEAFVTLYAVAHILSQMVFTEAIIICCREFKLNLAIDDFEQKMKELKQIIGWEILNAMNNYLKEKDPQLQGKIV